MKRDLLVVYHEYAEAVCDALNTKGVKPPFDDSKTEGIAAVMVIVGVAPNPPYGGALNYDWELEAWSVTNEVQMGQPVEDEPGEKPDYQNPYRNVPDAEH